MHDLTPLRSQVPVHEWQEPIPLHQLSANSTRNGHFTLIIPESLDMPVNFTEDRQTFPPSQGDEDAVPKQPLKLLAGCPPPLQKFTQG